MKRLPTRSKESTHAHIVDVGARAIRRHGFNGIGMADLMKLAGLTHGGFYSHFASREAMLAKMTDRADADADAVDTFLHIMAAAPTGHAHQALLEAYLSSEHVRDPEHGCPVAALGTEMPRQSPAVRRAATRCIKVLLDIVTHPMVDAADATSPAARERAIAAAATLSVRWFWRALSMTRHCPRPSCARRGVISLHPRHDPPFCQAT
ncbi:TetR/AcrR family transcriptional regulator [Variovorax sp. J22G40]